MLGRIVQPFASFDHLLNEACTKVYQMTRIVDGIHADQSLFKNEVARKNLKFSGCKGVPEQSLSRGLCRVNGSQD